MIYFLYYVGRRFALFVWPWLWEGTKQFELIKSLIAKLIVELINERMPENLEYRKQSVFLESLSNWWGLSLEEKTDLVSCLCVFPFPYIYVSPPDKNGAPQSQLEHAALLGSALAEFKAVEISFERLANVCSKRSLPVSILKLVLVLLNSWWRSRARRKSLFTAQNRVDLLDPISLAPTFDHDHFFWLKYCWFNFFYPA